MGNDRRPDGRPRSPLTAARWPRRYRGLVFPWTRTPGIAVQSGSRQLAARNQTRPTDLPGRSCPSGPSPCSVSRPVRTRGYGYRDDSLYSRCGQRVRSPRSCPDTSLPPCGCLAPPFRSNRKGYSSFSFVIP